MLLEPRLPHLGSAHLEPGTGRGWLLALEKAKAREGLGCEPGEADHEQKGVRPPSAMEGRRQPPEQPRPLPVAHRVQRSKQGLGVALSKARGSSGQEAATGFLRGAGSPVTYCCSP